MQNFDGKCGRGRAIALTITTAMLFGCAGASSLSAAGGQSYSAKPSVAVDAKPQTEDQPLFGGPAASQKNTWDWGGEKEVASSGKSVVSIDKQIIVSFQDRRLYLVTKTGEALSYPIAIPRQQDDWQGEMIVSDKKVNPSWTPTPTMIKENPRLPAWVPGGHPYNPLGVRALYLGSTAYRIHGTDAPWTIGEPVSKGCIRMYNKDVVDLYDRVPVGTKVIVNWTSYSSKVANVKN